MYRKTTTCYDCGNTIEFKSEDVFTTSDGKDEVYAVNCIIPKCFGVVLLNKVQTKFGKGAKP